MSILSLLDITEISLLISVAAIVIVIVFFGSMRRELELVKSEVGDSDASTLVSEFLSREKKMEERLVDEKVRLEILELRMQRELGFPNTIVTNNMPTKYNGRDNISDQEMMNLSNYTLALEQHAPNSIVGNKQRQEVFKKRDEASEDSNNYDQKNVRLEPVPTEINVVSKRDRVISEILGAVYEKQGSVTAREIQERIGRSREHTGRMMNLLYKQGLVSRRSGSRPFTYSLTEAGQRELNL